MIENIDLSGIKKYKIKNIHNELDYRVFRILLNAASIYVINLMRLYDLFDIDGYLFLKTCQDKNKIIIYKNIATKNIIHINIQWISFFIFYREETYNIFGYFVEYKAIYLFCKRCNGIDWNSRVNHVQIKQIAIQFMHYINY